MTATTRYAQPDAIVDTRWLAGNLRDPSLRVFDCTTHLRYETGVRRRMLWDSEDAGLTEAPAHLVGEVRRLGADASSVAGGWCSA
jgi:hypothetical protein